MDEARAIAAAQSLWAFYATLPPNSDSRRAALIRVLVAFPSAEDVRDIGADLSPSARAAFSAYLHALCAGLGGADDGATSRALRVQATRLYGVVEELRAAEPPPADHEEEEEEAALRDGDDEDGERDEVEAANVQTPFGSSSSQVGVAVGTIVAAALLAIAIVIGVYALRASWGEKSKDAAPTPEFQLEGTL